MPPLLWGITLIALGLGLLLAIPACFPGWKGWVVFPLACVLIGYGWALTWAGWSASGRDDNDTTHR